MAKDIDRKTVQRVVALRRKGLTWPEIMTKLNQPRSFVLRVRAQMKELDPSMVKPLGPGSPSYGKKSKARKRRAKARA